MHRYALEIRKTDLPLLTFLNGDKEPPIKPKTYLVVELDGRNHTTYIVTYRELLSLEFSGIQPFLMKLKK